MPKKAKTMKIDLSFEKALSKIASTNFVAPKKRTQASASLPEGALGMAIVHKDTTKKKD